ncbi:MAG: hypothetical protein SCALA702_06270 [Melioribacteraceae bacterium]|nr:MAG: hypothetical protein SCALA702_06270 [Melioribacteraceae bacterium]
MRLLFILSLLFTFNFLYPQLNDTVRVELFQPDTFLDTPGFLQPGNFNPLLVKNNSGRSVYLWSFSYEAYISVPGYKYYDENNELIYERTIPPAEPQNVQSLSAAINEEGYLVVVYGFGLNRSKVSFDIISPEGNPIIQNKEIFGDYNATTIEGLNCVISESKIAICWYKNSSTDNFYLQLFSLSGKTISDLFNYPVGEMHSDFDSELHIAETGEVLFAYKSKSAKYSLMANVVGDGIVAYQPSKTLFSTSYNFTTDLLTDQIENLWIVHNNVHNGFYNIILSKYEKFFGSELNHYELELYSTKKLNSPEIFENGGNFEILFLRENDEQITQLEKVVSDYSGILLSLDMLMADDRLPGMSRYYTGTNIEYYYHDSDSGKNIAGEYDISSGEYGVEHAVFSEIPRYWNEEIEFCRGAGKNYIVFNRLKDDTTTIKLQIVTDEGNLEFEEALNLYTTSGVDVFNDKINYVESGHLVISFSERLPNSLITTYNLIYNLDTGEWSNPVPLFDGTGENPGYEFDVITAGENRLAYLYQGTDELLYFNSFNVVTGEMGEPDEVNRKLANWTRGYNRYCMQKKPGGNIYVFWQEPMSFFYRYTWCQVYDQEFNPLLDIPLSINYGSSPFGFEMLDVAITGEDNLLLLGKVPLGGSRFSLRGIEGNMDEVLSDNWYEVDVIDPMDPESQMEFNSGYNSEVGIVSFYDYYNWITGRMAFYKNGYGRVGEVKIMEEDDYYFYDYRKSYISGNKIYSVFGRWGKFLYNMMPIFRVEEYEMEIVNSIDDTQADYRYLLKQNYPNPFNPATTLEFVLEENSNVVLEIFNSLGERVSTVVNGEMESGNHKMEWDGSSFASGVYFARIIVRENSSEISYQKQIKLLLLK